MPRYRVAKRIRYVIEIEAESERDAIMRAFEILDDKESSEFFEPIPDAQLIIEALQEDKVLNTDTE